MPTPRSDRPVSLDGDAGQFQRVASTLHVAILPGSAFGRPADEPTARLSYVNFDGAQALEASALVPDGEELTESFLRGHCGETLEAVDRLCNWINE